MIKYKPKKYIVKHVDEWNVTLLMNDIAIFITIGITNSNSKSFPVIKHFNVTLALIESLTLMTSMNRWGTSNVSDEVK